MLLILMDILSTDLRLLDADSEAELFASVCKLVGHSLKSVFCVGNQGCIVSKEHLPDEHCPHLRPGA